MKLRDIRLPDENAFERFGTVIDGSTSDGFQVILTEEDAPGWRIAVRSFSARSCSALHRHPDTRESFEPLSGVALLLVAPPDDPDAWEVFLLDRPVCIHRAVWHDMVSLSARAAVKITENAQVSTERHPLKGAIRVGTALIR